MSDEEKLIAELAAQFLLASITKNGLGSDPVYGFRALKYAKQIVQGAKK